MSFLKRSQNKTEDLVKMLAHTVRSISECVSITDTEDNIIFVNDALLKTYGYEEDELIGQSISILRTPEITKDYVDNIRPSTLSGGWQGELEQRKKNGNPFFVFLSTSVIRDDTGSLLAFVGIATDITDRKKSEESLIESARSFKGLFDSLSDAIYIQDENGKFLDVNRGAVNMYGYEKEEFFGNNPGMLAAEGMNDLEETFRKVRAASDGKTQTFEWWGRRKSGEIFPKEVVLNKGRYFGQDVIIAQARDISERKKVEKALIQSKEKAENADKFKTTLMQNMSHEFRTPLSAILGFTELIIGETQNPEHKEMLYVVSDSGKRLFNTLTLILNMAELDSGEYKTYLTNFNLCEEVKNVLKYFEGKIESKNLSSSIIIPDEDVFIYNDRNIINRILTELTDNAVKFTKSGNILIEVKHGEDEGNVFVMIKIKDTGIGIAPEQIGLIFQEFRQVSEGISRSYEGTGLGLSVVKKMVDILGARIEVISSPGRGSEFNIYLPVENVYIKNKNHGNLNTISTNETGKEVLTYKLLVVEDNFSNKKLMEVLLRKIASSNVDFASDGHTAINLCGEVLYDAVIMDINLGIGMTGTKALKEIRKIKGYENIPVIAVTGYAMSGDKENLISEGFNDYIRKPFTKDVFINTVKKNLTKK